VVVFQQAEVSLAVWVVCVADCALEDRCLYPMHHPFEQVKGIGDEEGNHHHCPLLKEWVGPL